MTFLGSRSMDRRTWATGAWSGGSFTQGALTTTLAAFTGTFRPAPQRTIELLPEAMRARDPKVLYTQQVLVETSQGDGTLADHVRPNGSTDWYEVTDIFDGLADLPSSPIKHRRYLCVKVQEVDG